MIGALSKYCFFCLILSLFSIHLKAQSTPLDTGNNINSSLSTEVEKKVRCYKIEEVEVIGNERTYARTIRQEMKLRLDSTYCSDNWEELLESDQAWIYGMSIFDTVSVTMNEIPGSTSAVGLVVSVKERWYVYPIPVFKISQYPLMYWWQHLERDFSYISYGAGLTHLNLRGLNDKLYALVQLGNERSIKLRYRGPYVQLPSGALLSYKITTSFSQIKSIIYDNSTQEVYDTQLREVFSQTKSTSTATLRYRPQINTEHRVTISFQYYSLSDTLHNLNPYFLQPKSRGSTKRRRALGLSYSFKTDRRKQPRYPLEGSYFEVNVSRNGLGAFSEMNLSRLRVFYGKYVPLGGKWYISTLLRTAFSAPFNQAYVDYQELNLGGNMRGYTPYLVQGPILLHSNVLLKKHIFHLAYRSKKKRKGLMNYLSYIPFTLYSYLYANAGYVHSYPDRLAQFNNRLLFGVGPGLELLSIYDVVFGAYYAFTRHGSQVGYYITIGGGT